MKPKCDSHGLLFCWHVQRMDYRPVLCPHSPSSLLSNPETQEWFAQEIGSLGRWGIPTLVVKQVPRKVKRYKIQVKRYKIWLVIGLQGNQPSIINGKTTTTVAHRNWERMCLPSRSLALISYWGNRFRFDAGYVYDYQFCTSEELLSIACITGILF